MINCSMMPPQNKQDDTLKPHIRREWMLISFKDFAKKDLVQNQAKIDLSSGAEHRKIRGKASAGCNTLFFSSEFKNNGKVTISDTGSTEKACRDMKLENLFFNHLKNVTDYKVEGHFLTLTDAQGNTMKFIAADWD